MLNEEGLQHVFDRHRRFAEAVRAAVHGWGLEIACRCAEEASSVVTTVIMPAGYDADEVRRIGHLGDFNELMLAATLCGVEMTLAVAGVPFRSGGVAAAMERLTGLKGQ